MMIFVVENDRNLSHQITHKLKLWGHETASAPSGNEALAYLEKHSPDLMILDYNLPDVKGKEFLWELKKKKDPLPLVIFFTEYADEQIAVDMIKMGARDYLAKNESFLTLLPAVVERVNQEIEKENLFQQAEEEKENLLQQTEEELRKYSLFLEQSPVSFVITDRDGHIENVNPKFSESTGYSIGEVLGKTPRILKSGEHPKEFYEELWKTILSGEIWKGELLNKKKNGELFWEETIIGPFIDARGKITHFIGIKRDITHRKKAEKEIQNLLDEKELLLQEVHHRIKNNMSTIISLLRLQSQGIDHLETAEAFKSAQSRIRSMMLLYEKLYCSGNFRIISTKAYLDPLVDEIVKSFSSFKKIKVEKQIEDFGFESKRIPPLGILVNELLANAMKYAFCDVEDGKIFLSFSKKPNYATLVVEDNGRGLPESLDLDNSKGFGLRLVKMLTEQMNGRVQVERRGGTKYTIDFEA